MKYKKLSKNTMGEIMELSDYYNVTPKTMLTYITSKPQGYFGECKSSDVWEEIITEKLTKKRTKNPE